MALPTNVAPELRLVPDETLAELRALNEANLPHLCSATFDVRSGTRVGGAIAATPTAILAAVPCRLVAQKRLPKAEMLAGDQPYAGDQWNLVFRVGVVVPEGALATITGTDALGAAWTRVVRVGTPLHSRAYEIESRYGARDVNVAGH
jgi:hypothetical protein